MAFRWSHLPPGLRQSVFAQLSQSSLRTNANVARNASTWTRQARFSSHYFTKVPAPVPRLGRKLLWAIPIAGGIGIFLLPKPQTIGLSTVFASPTLIPCPDPNEFSLYDKDRIDVTILSPDEEGRSLLSRFGSVFIERIWEPILTARRFIHLLYLFIPVLFSAPMLLIGRPEDRLQGDRWGAVWWYGFLTAQMQKAGPTFVKVCSKVFLYGYICGLTMLFLSAFSVGGFTCGSISCPTLRSTGSPTLERNTPFPPAYPTCY